jgi:hypothetical protein
MNSWLFLGFSLAIRGLAERERRRIIYFCRNFGSVSACWKAGVQISARLPSEVFPPNDEKMDCMTVIK